MIWLEAVLAFALTMLVFSIMVSVLVEAASPNKACPSDSKDQKCVAHRDYPRTKYCSTRKPGGKFGRSRILHSPTGTPIRE